MIHSQGVKSGVGWSIGPLGGTPNWRFVVSPTYAGDIDVGTIVSTQVEDGYLLSSVLEIEYVTNVESLDVHVASIAVRRGSLAGSDRVREIKAVAVAVCSPIERGRSTKSVGEPTKLTNNVPPMMEVSVPPTALAAEACGLQWPVPDVELGHAKGFGKKVGVSASDFFTHALIIGTTGTGKTRLAASIASQLARSGQCTVVVVDRHGEYKALMPNGSDIFTSNPGPSGVGLAISDLRGEQLKAFLEELPPPSQAVIRDLHAELVDQKEETMRDWPGNPAWTQETELDHFEKMLKSFPGHRLSKEAILRSLDRLYRKPIFRGRGGKIDDAVWNKKNIIIDTHKLDKLSESVFVGGLLNRLYRLRTWEGDQGAVPLPLVVVIEEAHRFCNDESPVNAVIVEYAREARKFGVSLILVTQRASDIADAVWANCGVVLAMRLGVREDVALVSSRILGFEKLAEWTVRFEPRRTIYSGRRGGVPCEFVARTHGP